METLSDLFTTLGRGKPRSPRAEGPLACDGQLASPAEALRFMTAGNATVTLRSRKTGARFTYRIRTSDDERVRFVSIMTGVDNESSFQYLGYARVGQEVYFRGAKSRITETAPSARAFAWAWRQLQAGRLPEALEVWHEGRCGRCGRKLTVPESVRSGFGPECVNLVKGEAR